MTMAKYASPTILLAASMLAAGLSAASATPNEGADAKRPPLVAPPTPAAASPADSAAASTNVFTAAPVPDLDTDFGVPAPKTPAKVQLNPSFYHQPDRPTGDGFVPNSTIYDEQNKRLHPAPGLNLSVPLE
jgi:hypothetical protein